MQEESQKELFKRLKIKSILDLALILPKSYEDTRLSTSITPNSQVVLNASVDRVYKTQRGFRVKFFLPKFKESIYGVFFKTTSYHYKTFSEGSTHIIQGKITLFRGSWQIVQPKSLKEYGQIITRYKSPIKEYQLKELIREYITKETLLNEGLTKDETKALLALHFPFEQGWQHPTTNYPERLISLLKSIEAYNHLKKLKSKRRYHKALKALTYDVDSFIASLPFSLTDDQRAVISKIREDLAREDIATRRIVIGDVGSGKTMVILASAVIAREGGSILMAPTSILANQIYQEAEKFLPKDMKIALLTQSKKIGDITKAEFIVGTHSILYSDNLPKVSLVMVDEQHRFGSNQRATLENLFQDGDKKPHFLQFSATPIPRTQAMIDSAMVDVSLIEQTPFKKSIDTKVIKKSDFSSLIEHIESEISQNHQVLIIYPLVEESQNIPYFSIDEAREFWEGRYEGVYVTHGKDKNKDIVLEEFRDNGKILLATTVVEVGISLPRLSMIVIVGAERLGLASLHQLRGRVGRNGLKSWCYLYTNMAQIPKRLLEFSKTTNGFDIAKLDLEYRDSGDILDGTIQSGQRFKWLNLATDEEFIKRAKERLKGD